jgi:hypothetical protein
MKTWRDIPAIYAEQKQGPQKVVFGIPIGKFKDGPHPQTVQSLRNAIPFVEQAGFEHGFTYTAGNPYISGARAEITRKALDWGADQIVYIDHDVSFDPEDLVKILTTEGEVVGGTYRCKVEEFVWMGAIYTHSAPDVKCDCGVVHEDPAFDGRPMVRKDGCIKARTLPAGFLKVTTGCIDKFMRSYPEMCYGPQYSLSVDLFNHGAHEGIWWGEDYAFCRKWEACGGENWLIPNMNIGHWEGDKCYEGNFHRYLCSMPGGSADPNREKEVAVHV